MDDGREVPEVDAREAIAERCALAPVGTPADGRLSCGTGGCPGQGPIMPFGNDFGRGLQRVEQLGDRVSHVSRERALRFLKARDELAVAGEDLPPEGSTGTGKDRVGGCVPRCETPYAGVEPP